jgi:hypothetical protein
MRLPACFGEDKIWFCFGEAEAEAKIRCMEGSSLSLSLSSSSPLVRSITCFTGAEVYLGGGTSSPPESKTSPSSENLAVDDGNWPTAGVAGMSIAKRLKRVAEPSDETFEEIGGCEN